MRKAHQAAKVVELRPDVQPEIDKTITAWMDGKSEPPTEVTKHAVQRCMELRGFAQKQEQELNQLKEQVDQATTNLVRIQGAFGGYMKDLHDAAAQAHTASKAEGVAK